MPRFDDLDRLGDAIGNVYADCVDRLLVNIARHFKYLKPGEAPGGAFQWQARKLAELGQVTRENVEIIRRMLGDVPAELAEGLEQAIMDALDGIEAPLIEAARRGLVSGQASPEPDPRAMKAFELYHGLRTAAPRSGSAAAPRASFGCQRGLVAARRRIFFCVLICNAAP